MLRSGSLKRGPTRSLPLEEVFTLPAESSAAKASGSATAICFCCSSVLRSWRLCCRWICRIEIAERSAIASGLSFSENGSNGGGRGADNGEPYCICDSDSGMEADGITGVMGEYGGATGDGGLSSLDL